MPAATVCYTVLHQTLMVRALSLAPLSSSFVSWKGKSWSGINTTQYCFMAIVLHEEERGKTRERAKSRGNKDKGPHEDREELE